MRYFLEIVSGKFKKHREIALIFTGILFTALATLTLLRDMGFLLEQKTINGFFFETIGQTLLIGIVLMMIYGNFLFQLIIFDGHDLYSPHKQNECSRENNDIGLDLHNKQITYRFMAAANRPVSAYFNGAA